MLPTKEWSSMTSEDLLSQMRQVQDNTFQMNESADAVVMHANSGKHAQKKSRDKSRGDGGALPSKCARRARCAHADEVALAAQAVAEGAQAGGAPQKTAPRVHAGTFGRISRAKLRRKARSAV